MDLRDRLRLTYEWLPECNRLLDLGCDRGDITILLTKKAKEVIGIDSNEDAIKAARNHKSTATFMVAKGERLPFPDKYFDVVLMSEVIEHVENEKETISEVHRILKKNGKLILSTPHKGTFRFIDSFNMKFYFPRLYKLWKGKQYNKKTYEIQPWHRHYSLNDLEKLLKGFTITRVHRGGFLIYPLHWVVGDMLGDVFGSKANWIRNKMSVIADKEFQKDFKQRGASIAIIAKKN